MAAGVVAVGGKLARKVRIQKQITHERTMNIRVTIFTRQVCINAAVGGCVTHREMTLLAQKIPRLAEKEIAFTAVSLVAFHAASAFNGIPGCRGVFEGIRAGLLRVAIATRLLEIRNYILAGAHNELVAVQTGNDAIGHRMVRPTGQVVMNVVVAGIAELGIVVQKQAVVRRMNAMAVGTIDGLICMNIPAVVVQADVGHVALEAARSLVETVLSGRVGDVVRRRIIGMGLGAFMTSGAGDLGSRIVDL
jgi:hypothetical protein